MLLVVAVVLGAVPAHFAAHRVPRDEIGLEGSSYAARRAARSALLALVRTDRASVWRAVPMRRGILVLALGPALVAVLGDLPWSTMTVLPGLVASGGALLFGVNVWCLDGRGALWRESLPVEPGLVFTARVVVLAEFLLAASLLTVGLAATRAGLPTAAEATALVCTLLVVGVQVVAASMRWSAEHPYAVDFRSARATPAPPLAMVGYSARLAVSTTVAGLVFSALSRLDDWWAVVLLAVPMLCWSSWRLLRARRRWLDPVDRARRRHHRRRVTACGPGVVVSWLAGARTSTTGWSTSIRWLRGAQHRWLRCEERQHPVVEVRGAQHPVRLRCEERSIAGG